MPIFDASFRLLWQLGVRTFKRNIFWGGGEEGVCWHDAFVFVSSDTYRDLNVCAFFPIECLFYKRDFLFFGRVFFRRFKMNFV